MRISLDHEQKLGGVVAGVDEAGRGPLAGPVVAAAVIIKPDFDITGINDSKKLTPLKRAILFERITSYCKYSVSIVDNAIIDEINILQATKLAMRECLAALQHKYDYALIDGNQSPDINDKRLITLIKGDRISISIAAASIVAKHTRDMLMIEHDANYPIYGFAKHMGYGTKAHMDAIGNHGLCPIHRATFLKRL